MYNNFSDNEFSKEKFSCCECCRRVEKEHCYYPSFWCEEDKKEKNCGFENKYRESWIDGGDNSKNYYGNNSCSCHREREDNNHRPGRNSNRCCFCSLFNCCRW